MAQWTKELHLHHVMETNVENTRQSEVHCAKLIKFTEDLNMKDTNADLSKPNAATKQPNAFSASCDEVTSSQKRLEPRLMKVGKMVLMLLVQLDYKSKTKEGKETESN